MLFHLICYCSQKWHACNPINWTVHSKLNGRTQKIETIALRSQLRTNKDVVDPTLHGMVDDFLLSLPLGTTARDAAVEERVAQCLLQLYKEKKALEDKLGEW